MYKEKDDKFLEDVKSFLRVDFEEDNYEIKGLIITAESYLKNAGCIVDYNNFLFTLAIKMLVSIWYEDKEVTEKSNYSLDAIITQLIYSYDGDVK